MIKKSSATKEYIKRFSTYFVVDSINKALPFLIMPILAAYLTTDEFGLVSNFSAIIQVAYAIIALNTYTKLSTDFFKKQDSLPSLYTNLSTVNFYAFTFVLLLVIVLNRVLEKAFFLHLKWQIVAVIIAFSMSVITLCTTYLQMKGKVKKYGIVQLGQSLSFFMLCVLFVVVFLWSWEGRIISSFISYSVCAIAIFIVAIKKNLIHFKAFNKELTWQYFLWGIPLLPHALSFWLKYGADKIIISNYIGLSENGFYSLALSLGGLTAIVNTSFFNTYSPYLYKKLHSFDETDYYNEKAAIINRLVNNSIYFILTNAIMSLLTYGVLLVLINLFFSGDYLSAICYLPYTILANFISCIYSIYSGFLFYRGKTKMIGTITFSSAILQVILNLTLIPLLGVWGAIWSAISVAIIISSTICVLSFKEYNILFYIKK